MYDVGQVIFVVSQRKIIPVQIAEQIVRRTLDGMTVEYKVAMSKNAKNFFDLDDVGNVHFDSLQSVRNYMLEVATKSINDMMKIAEDEFHGKFDLVDKIAAEESRDSLKSA